MAQDPTASLRRQLVEQLTKAGAIRGAAVARAMARAPRHLFVPEYPLHLVYGDRALVTKTRAGVGTSSSSQPAIMAVMLEALRPRRGMNVLEIGAGTGYNAALLRELVGPDGAVTSIDIQADVTARARRNLGVRAIPMCASCAATGRAGCISRRRLTASSSRRDAGRSRGRGSSS
jgi:protein-L-isoaspartate(D-aspartate) O-methyltransferase